MTDQQCTACKSSRVSLIQPRTMLTYQKCEDCGHCKQLIATDDVSKTFVEMQAKYYGESSQLLSVEPGLFELEILEERFSMLNSFLSRPSKILEVGPGSGHVLAWLLDRGHFATGVEHSPVLARQLSERLSTSIIVGEFESLELEFDSIDVFCSFHVIEHVRDPLAHLTKAYAIVRPGGFAFVATPNARSWQQIAFPSLSPNFDSAHLHVFSLASLRVFSEVVGWNVVSISTPEHTAGWARVLTKAVRRLKGEDEEETAGKYASMSSRWGLSVATILKTATLPFRATQRYFQHGNEAFLVLQKPLSAVSHETQVNHLA